MSEKTNEHETKTKAAYVVAHLPVIEQGGLDENPAVQLYQLVMRAVRESNVFTAAEKSTLRKLLVSCINHPLLLLF